MKKRNLYYLLLLIFIIMSCKYSDKGKQKEHYSVISFSDLDLNRMFYWGDLIDTFWVVPLETNDNNLIGYVNKMSIVNDTIFILDKRHTKSIFAFNIDGNFLFKINSLGQGPGEYVQIDDFVVSEGFIELYDSRSGKIIIYDMNGLFSSEFEVGFLGTSFYKTKSSYVFYSGFLATKYDTSGKYGLIITDLSGKLLKKRYPITRCIGKLNYSKDIVFYNNDLFSPCLSSFIYEIDNDDIRKLFYVDKSEFDFNECELEIEDIFNHNSTSIYSFKNIIKGGNHILFEFIYQNRSAYALYDTKASLVIKSGLGVFGTSQTLSLPCMPLVYYDKYYVSVIDENSIRSQLIHNNTDISFLSEYEGLPYFNPVLTFHNIK